MGNTRISASTEPSELADAGGLGMGDKCSDSSDCSDCGVTVPAIGDGVLSGAFGCA